jgi:hypothetical protein
LDRTEAKKTKVVRACDENARREMASHNSLMDPTGKKEEGMREEDAQDQIL